MTYNEYRNYLIAKFEALGYTHSPLSFEQIANLHQMGADVSQGLSIAHDIVIGIPADRAFERNL